MDITSAISISCVIRSNYMYVYMRNMSFFISINSYYQSCSINDYNIEIRIIDALLSNNTLKMKENSTNLQYFITYFICYQLKNNTTKCEQNNDTNIFQYILFKFHNATGV